MPTTIAILPLPDTNNLLQGFYGIEQCSVRGLVRISHEPGFASLTRRTGPLRIQSMSITLSGVALCLYTDISEGLDVTKREHVLLFKTVDLLTEIEVVLPGTVLEIPFDVPFPPDPDPATLPPPPPGTTPSPHLLPPSSAFLGRQSGGVNTYQGRVTYEVTATLTEVVGGAFSSIFGAVPTTRTATASLHPFQVYDPRLLPTLLHPDIRRWRSAPGAVPVEYDIEVGSVAMGPGDPLRFAYRVVVASESARKGVRLKKISLVLREHHVVGEQRCQGRVDDPEFPIERKGTKVKGTTELLRWEQTEQLPEASDGEFELSHIPRKETIRSPSEKSPLPRPGLICRGGDGLYAESETVLRIPSLGGFAPSTAKITNPPPVPAEGTLLPAHVEVRHSLQVIIEFIGADKLVMESGCVLASVGKDDCDVLLREEPALVPPLDYDKVVGGEVWVPEYTPRDELADEVKHMSGEALEAVWAVLRAEGGEAIPFFPVAAEEMGLQVGSSEALSVPSPSSSASSPSMDLTMDPVTNPSAGIPPFPSDSPSPLLLSSPSEPIDSASESSPRISPCIDKQVVIPCCVDVDEVGS
ncbi:hypothetical protein SpCBS45565_g00735 [Spizellomyces sp. 'palustris']|nr:hypothetical protein SpCBS45565_g00735 [Spizellomyces sp. 'palustris']